MTALDDLRRRVEALEGRAATKKSSAPAPAADRPLRDLMAHHLATIREALPPEPAPAPAADRPLWDLMAQARYSSDGPRMGSVRLATAAEIDAVADWFDARGCHGSAHDLRIEARRAREGA